jgi:hypothetical protein
VSFFILLVIACGYGVVAIIALVDDLAPRTHLLEWLQLMEKIHVIKWKRV